MAEIVSLSTIDLFGGSRTIVAYVRVEGESMTVSLTGTQKGRPGHVKVRVGDTDVPVPFPERYGDQFNEDWVRTYWNSNTTKEEEA